VKQSSIQYDLIFLIESRLYPMTKVQGFAAPVYIPPVADISEVLVVLSRAQHGRHQLSEMTQDNPRRGPHTPAPVSVKVVLTWPVDSIVDGMVAMQNATTPILESK